MTVGEVAEYKEQIYQLKIQLNMSTELSNTNENGNCANRVLATGVFIVCGDKITFQRAEYIEDGWYVELIDEDISLWKIPYGGGEPIKIGGYWDLISAIKAGTELS